MESINWLEEVHKRKDLLLKETCELLQIKSVLDEDNTAEDAPLGKGVKEALDYMLKLGEKDGFSVKNVDHLAGYIEFGEGKECVGILCHVDVVPAGDDWNTDPFGAVLKDGKIYARGALDDKGPTMAAYYAMKIVKELGLPLNRRVRMIIGTDEESDWRCVDHYFKHEEMPTFGFAPDADFPIIFAEKGICDIHLVQHLTNERETGKGEVEVIRFDSGLRLNMVPDYAKATVVCEDVQHVVGCFEAFLRENQLEGKYTLDESHLLLEVKGVSAHGFEPNNGRNAGLFLASFLAHFRLDSVSQPFIQFVHEFLYNDSRGKKLNIAYADEITGELTVNVGILSFSKEEGGKIGLNVRYPVSTNFEKVMETLKKTAEENKFSIEKCSNSKPHHVNPDEFLVKTLQKVYEEQTGEKAELLAIGGGTYARALEVGVAFGPLFPGRSDVAHQKDEYFLIEDLLKATAIYAQAIYELAR